LIISEHGTEVSVQQYDIFLKRVSKFYIRNNCEHNLMFGAEL